MIIIIIIIIITYFAGVKVEGMMMRFVEIMIYSCFLLSSTLSLSLYLSPLNNSLFVQISISQEHPSIHRRSFPVLENKKKKNRLLPWEHRADFLSTSCFDIVIIAIVFCHHLPFCYISIPPPKVPSPSPPSLPAFAEKTFWSNVVLYINKCAS